MPIKRLLALLVLTLAPAALMAGPYVTYESAANAIRDNNGDGTPDALAPYAQDYVYHDASIYTPTSTEESRAFVEFALSPALGSFNSAVLNFDAFRYNSPHVPPQTLSLYGFQDDGTISLSDWNASATLLGTTAPIAGYATNAQRGQSVPLSFNITGAFQAAVNAHASHFAIYVKNPVVSLTDSGDPLGYSSLLTVDNFTITTSTVQPSHVPDSGSMLTLLALAAAALAGLAAMERRRQPVTLRLRSSRRPPL